MKTLINSLLALFTLITLNSCSEQVDSIAPVAPVATVATTSQTASAWTSVGSWTKDANQDNVSYKNFTDANITAPVVEEGMVVVFYRNAQTKQLLGTLPAKVGTTTLGFSYDANQGKGNVNLYQEGGSLSTQLEYRWVVVSKAQLGQVNWTNYSSVQQALHLQD